MHKQSSKGTTQQRLPTQEKPEGTTCERFHANALQNVGTFCKHKTTPKTGQRKMYATHAKTMLERHQQKTFEKTTEAKTQNVGKYCLKDMETQRFSHVTACKHKAQQASQEHVWKHKENIEKNELRPPRQTATNTLASHTTKPNAR